MNQYNCQQTAITNGIGFGCMLATVISWSLHQSILWAKHCESLGFDVDGLFVEMQNGHSIKLARVDEDFDFHLV